MRHAALEALSVPAIALVNDYCLELARMIAAKATDGTVNAHSGARMHHAGTPANVPALVAQCSMEAARQGGL